MTAATVERRSYEIREASATGRRLTGYAAVFNARANIGDPLTYGFVEQVAPGAFADSLRAGDDVIFVIDHDPSRVLARVSNGTLKLAEDRRGLAVDADMADVTYGRDLAALVQRGDVKGMSFRFQVVADDWTSEVMPDAAGQLCQVEVRTLKAVKLLDVCTTALPAYAQTEADVRSARRAKPGRRPGYGTLDLRMRALAAYYRLPKPGGRR